MLQQSLRTAVRVAFASVLVSPIALCDSFEPNHMFISCHNSKNIVEFDENGAFVRAITPTGLDSPQSLAFGPNGLLYVTSFATNQLFEIQPNGTVSNKHFLGNNVGPNAVRVGPEGFLYVNGQTDKKLHRVEVMDGPIHEIGPIPLQTQSLNDFEFTSAGTMVAVATNTSTLYELNLLGVPVRTKDISASPFPTGIAIGPFDLVWYSALGGNSLSRATSSLAVLDTFPVADLGSPTGIVQGPNGKLFVCSQANDLVVTFDPKTFQTTGAIGFNVPAMDGPWGIAFSPYRFEAEISGRFGGDEDGTKSVKGDVFLQVAPGSRTITVQFIEGTGSQELADLFVETGFVFHGTETGDPSKKRIYTGIEMGLNAGSGSGRIDLEVKTSTSGALGFLRAKSATGRIARSGAGGAFFGEIKTTKLVD